MRRSLVLTDEAARHPFRVILPPHVRKGQGEAAPRGWRLSRHDVRLFLATYLSGSLAALIFLF